MKSLFSSILTGLVLAAAFQPAHAQWIWKDENGRTVASDQPPPKSVPLSHIVKSPRARGTNDAAVDANAPVKDGDSKDADKKDGKVDAVKADAPKSLADRDLDYKKRQKDAAEAEQKQQADATKAKAMQENCTAMRGNMAALQAGGRTARVNEKGERYYLDDAQRQGEVEKTRGQIEQFCK